MFVFASKLTTHSKQQNYLITHTRATDFYGFGWHCNGRQCVLKGGDVLTSKTTSQAITVTKKWHTGGAVGGVAMLTVFKELKLSVAMICNTQLDASVINRVVSAVHKKMEAIIVV